MEIKCGYLYSGTINISDRAAVIRRLHREADVCQAPVGVLRNDLDVL